MGEGPPGRAARRRGAGARRRRGAGRRQRARGGASCGPTPRSSGVERRVPRDDPLRRHARPVRRRLGDGARARCRSALGGAVRHGARRGPRGRHAGRSPRPAVRSPRSSATRRRWSRLATGGGWPTRSAPARWHASPASAFPPRRSGSTASRAATAAAGVKARLRPRPGRIDPVTDQARRLLRTRPRRRRRRAAAPDRPRARRRLRRRWRRALAARRGRQRARRNRAVPRGRRARADVLDHVVTRHASRRRCARGAVTGPFDTICTYDVLEHLVDPEPVAALRCATSRRPAAACTSRSPTPATSRCSSTSSAAGPSATPSSATATRRICAGTRAAT